MWRAFQQRTLVVISAVVVAETTQGGPRDARINRVLKSVHDVTPVTEQIAREAGHLLAISGKSSATVDALIVAEAARPTLTVILTGDAQDISALAAGYPHVRVHSV